MRLTAGAPWQSGRGQLLRVWVSEPRERGYGGVGAWLPGAVGEPQGRGYGVQGHGCKVRRGPKSPGYGCRGLPKGRVYGYCTENCRGVSSGTFRGVVTGLGWVPQEYDYGCRGEPQEQRYRVQEGNCRCGNTVQR